MVLGSRRLVTLAASTLAAVAFAAAVGGRSCAGEDDSPEGAVKSFIAAASAGDREAAYELLGPETRERLEKAREHARELGKVRNVDVLDLIAIGRPNESWSLKRISARESNGRTVVEIEDSSGQLSIIPVVKVDGKWKIEIPSYGGGT